MSLLDLIVLLFIAASVVGGFVAGFARSGIGFLAAVFGVLCGFWFYGIPAAAVHKYVHSVTASNLIGFFVVFFGLIFVGALIGKLLSKLFKWTGLSWLDRLMGAAFGLVRGALVAVAFIAVLLAFTPKPTPNWMVNSTSRSPPGPSLSWMSRSSAGMLSLRNHRWSGNSARWR